MTILHFEPNATDYSLSNARLMAQASAIAYQDDAACKKWATGHGFDRCEFFTESSAGVDTQGFIASSDSVILVAFRGSEPKVAIDWLDDAQCIHMPWGYKAGKVHAGFFKALNAVWQVGGVYLPAMLTGRKTQTVWITGHSLGGALAELCGAQAAFLAEVPVAGVYTFGQPRLGDEDFAKAVHEKLGVKVFRHINHRDIVPRVPLFSMSYRHYGCEIYFDSNRRPQRTDGRVEDLIGAIRSAEVLFTEGVIADALNRRAKAMLDLHIHPAPFKFLKDLMGNNETRIGLLEGLVKEQLDHLSVGAEPVADHSMTGGYLPNLEVSLAD